MTKTKFAIAGVVAIAAIAALLVAQRQAAGNLAQARLRQENEALREQLRQTQEMARPEVDPAELERLRKGEKELLRLRGEVARLRQQVQASALSNQAVQVTAEENAAKVPALGNIPRLGEFFRSQTNAVGGQSRAVTPESLASAMVETNPAAALAFGEQLNPTDRRRFLDSAFATWARNDTDAALQWAEQLPAPLEKDAAMKAIQSVAPVGIGAELRQQDGYAVINRLLSGSPAELSGQLHPGDRILAIAQGDNAFVDARNLALADLVQNIRGVPGSLIQLQVMPADASPDSPPVTVTLNRDQIKYKR